MARLVSVRGENFAGFREFALPLGTQGLVLIVGENRDTAAASSNGACKSGLFKAIGWCLYGEAVDGEVGDKVIHHGEKVASVEVEILDGPKEREDRYVVTRERSRGAPRLFLEKNGLTVEAAKADVQRLIDQLVGVDWEGFRNTVLYAQSDRDRFVYPTTKDSERKEILHRILRTSVFGACHAEAKRRRLEVDKQKSSLDEDVRRLTERIDDCDIDALQARVDGWAAEAKVRRGELEAEAREFIRRAKEARASVDVTRLKASLRNANEVLKEAEAAKQKRQEEAEARHEAETDAVFEVSRIRSELARVRAALEELAGDVCPTCNSPLEKGRACAHKAKLERDDTRLDLQYRQAQKRQGDAEAASVAAAAALKSIAKQHLALVEAKMTVEGSIALAKESKKRGRELAGMARMKRKEIERLLESENPHAAALKTAREKVKRLQKERRAARKGAKELAVRLGELEFWVRGFGAQGIPSFALDSAMPFLTQRANAYLEILADGDISIEFQTQRELKSGEVRDEIEIRWTIEGIDGYPPSGGQWKKIEIATSFALMDLVATREGSHVNLLCLDECLDGLDIEGRQRVVALLHAQRSTRESVFVISHDAELAEAFGRTVKVIKEDGVSRVELSG